jgi:hypothetical protein
MKPLKLGLRIWIALSSLVAFLGGWAFFSHSNKPVPLVADQNGSGSSSTQQDPQTLQPLPTLQPVPSFDQLSNSSSFQAQPLQQPSFSSIFSNASPRLRTRGS